jgi:cytochrome b pre-mRNA-processing protein 3
MLKWFKTRAENQRKADKLYGAIVARARCAQFYARLGVSDTPEGRYEIVVLHLFLVLERLRDEPGIGQALPRLLVERFVSDMDDSLRELGTGDLSVPKKVRRAAAGLYERVTAYRPVVAAGDAKALAHLIASYVFLADDADWRSTALARYTVKVMAELARQGVGAISTGQIAFPDVVSHKEDVQ